MQPEPQFVPAKFQTPAPRRRVDWVVVHTTEGPCAAGRAVRAAQAEQAGERRASAHYFVDPTAVVQCVHEYDVAWHCQGANRYGVGVEHCASGLGELVPATDWGSPEAQAMLRLSATLVLEVAARWGVPLVRLRPADIVAGRRGIFGHADASQAFGTPGGHRDPGPSWPWEEYMSLLTSGPTPPPTEGEAT